MQIRLRDVLLANHQLQIENHPDFLDIFSVKRQISTLVVMWTNIIYAAYGLRFSLMSMHQYRPLGVEKAIVRCALGVNGIIGPYWFEDSGGRPLTVNTNRHIELMRRKFIPALRRKRRVDMDTVIFQQDGATPHCSNTSLEYLHWYFAGDRLIYCRRDHLWPARSPDISSLDYFLWDT